MSSDITLTSYSSDAIEKYIKLQLHAELNIVCSYWNSIMPLFIFSEADCPCPIICRIPYTLSKFRYHLPVFIGGKERKENEMIATISHESIQKILISSPNEQRDLRFARLYLFVSAAMDVRKS
jgi:hypothetical protein